MRALVKLEQVLPSHLRRRVQALGTATMTLAAGGPDRRPAGADADRGRLPRPRAPALRLPGREGEQPRREVEPHSLVNVGRRWYLVAWDCGPRTGARSASTGIDRPAARPRFQPRELPAKDAARVRVAVLSARPNRYEARLTLHAPAEETAQAAVPRYAGPFEPVGDDRCEYRTGDDNLDWLAARISMLGVDFEVHEPPELIAHLQALVGGFARARPAA